MTPIAQTQPPPDRLIAPYARRDGHYADAFRADVPGAHDLAAFLGAFYATPLFRAERAVLSLAGVGGSDDALLALAAGATETFAAWTVEARRPDEILLADVSGRTRSWLAVSPVAGGTRLWFGSVIVPVMRGGRPPLGPVFTLLTRPHRAYSRALLAAAVRRVLA
jgi:hypothetical protein